MINTLTAPGMENVRVKMATYVKKEQVLKLNLIASLNLIKMAVSGSKNGILHLYVEVALIYCSLETVKSTVNVDGILDMNYVIILTHNTHRICE